VDRRRGDTGRAVRSDCAHEAELRQRRHAIVQADLFCDLAVFDTKDCRSGEPHLPARARRERTLKKVTERRAGVCATANSTTDDVVAFRDEIRRARETQIGERFAERRHERLHIRTTAAWRMQRVLQEDVGRAEFVHDCRIPGGAPEFGEPSADDDFVVLFFSHDRLLHAPANVGQGPRMAAWPPALERTATRRDYCPGISLHSASCSRIQQRDLAVTMPRTVRLAQFFELVEQVVFLAQSVARLSAAAKDEDGARQARVIRNAWSAALWPSCFPSALLRPHSIFTAVAAP
jgi:hypothetical protein